MEPENQNNESSDSNGVVEAEVVNESAADPEQNNQDAEKQSYGLKQCRTFAVIGYIIPPIFFLSLIDENTKQIPFARFHANQQLIILIMLLALQFLHSTVLIMLGSLGSMIMSFASVAIFALAVWGAYHAYKEKMKDLPFVGHFRILN